MRSYENEIKKGRKMHYKQIKKYLKKKKINSTSKVIMNGMAKTMKE